ncbi:TetR/AcrR family transcriptional regulator [Dactylosporangium matsuzakiense]|uniref:TetR family transcriptional regulator n=1 Tax=Dactylosporangium matsuzakiense TaxID=53360 RepID=A0A9W6KUT4_9ACTN|nr:TetR/AcrR family transcriptional regulator [Dactylosporangium matsuzakiense]UWZ42436.1 TetR/AcrR family transcriptional regulator [Dactylosporangium matsuzakiense]GLL08063.1 TetR family transcriptional regulator [Dactylosporangium matsuzakiense]
MAGERGRPRAFDADAALDRAAEVFWRQGYEGASLSDLTEAMGINRPSLYAAYGNKDALFRRAVARYAEIDMAYVRAAIAEPTAFAVVEHLLRANADALTRTDRPAGCLSIQGGLASGSDGGRVAQFLAASRLAGERALAERLERALDEGDLPAGTDAAALARYVMVVSEGNAVHAAGGADRAALHATVDIALRAVPRP